MRCVGVPIGTPDFVNAYVRAKAVEIGNDVQKLSIITDPKIHYDLLRFCQHTRMGFLSRNLSPEVMMTSSNGVFASEVCQALRKAKIQDWGSGMMDMVGPRHAQDSITRAILQRGMGGTFDRKPPADKAWCRMIVELPHHRGGLAITPLPASGIAGFYHATARLVAWLGSLPPSHSSQWAQNQDLADSTTWTSSSLTSLKTVHSQLLADYGCTEWAPPAADDANDAAAAQQR